MKFKSSKICLMLKIKYLARNFCIKILFCNRYFSPLNTWYEKRREGSDAQYGIIFS